MDSSEKQSPRAELMPKSETIACRKRYLGEACELFFQHDPLKIVGAKGQYLYDEKGNKYLDCVNNVSHVGHCCDRVVAAETAQCRTLNTNSRFLHDNLALYASKLASIFPDPLSVCFFVNSGSEANDLAIQLARCHTKRNHVISVDRAYHGVTSLLMELSSYKFKSEESFQSLPDWLSIVKCPDVYRGAYTEDKNKGQDLGLLYANDVQEVISQIEKEGRKLAAFIVESIQSCGGQIVPPPKYMANVFRHVRKSGGVCIVDEVQVGFGRVGKWWAFQLQGDDVVPDIVTLGKPMGNGHPISAVITTREIAESFKKRGITYFSTFGGNPVSCAIGLAVLEEIEDKKLMKRAREVGEYLLRRLNTLKEKQGSIGDVRGEGLLVGIELVRDRGTKTPARELASFVVNKMKENYIILSSDGPYRNVIKIKPPMVFDESNADTVVESLDVILTEAKNSPELCAEN